MSVQGMMPNGQFFRLLGNRVAFVAVVSVLLFSRSSLAQATSPGVAPQMSCGEACDPGGGGGGGGGTPPPNYNLNWGSPSEAGGVVIGGWPGREGPAVGELSNLTYVAYTSPSDPVGDQYNDNYVYIRNLSGQFSRINSQTGFVSSDANPALQLFSGYLYLAVNNSEFNPARYNGGFTGLFRTGDGVTWNLSPGTQPGATSNFPYVDNSPSLTASSQYLFSGYRNAADYTLTICRTDPYGNSDCTNFPGSRAMNFNPSLAYLNGVLYIGYEEYDNAHALRMFTSTDNGQTISENTNISNVNGDQTSTAPSLNVFRNTLYVGFRTNDSGQSFLYRYSTDGINYSVRQGTGEQMNGAPTLFSPTNPNNTYSGYMLNFYSSDDGHKYLTQNTASHN